VHGPGRPHFIEEKGKDEPKRVLPWPGLTTPVRVTVREHEAATLASRPRPTRDSPGANEGEREIETPAGLARLRARPGRDEARDRAGDKAGRGTGGGEGPGLGRRPLPQGFPAPRGEVLHVRDHP
jgi:hypothetical protein